MLSVKSLTVTGLQWYCAFMHPGFINGVPSGYTGVDGVVLGVAGVGVDGVVLGESDGWPDGTSGCTGTDGVVDGGLAGDGVGVAGGASGVLPASSPESALSAPRVLFLLRITK